MLTPIGSKLLIKARDAESATRTGILIPLTQGQKQQVADVIAAGEGHVLNDGTIHPLSVKAGDIIIYEKFAGTNIFYEDEHYLVIDESNVLVKISNDN